MGKGFTNMFPEAQIYHLVEAAVRKTFVVLFCNLFPLVSDKLNAVGKGCSTNKIKLFKINNGIRASEVPRK